MKKAVFCLTLAGSLFMGAFQLMATTSTERNPDMYCGDYCDLRYTACLNRGFSVSTCDARYLSCMSNCN